MNNVNKYVKALSAFWLIISFAIASSIVADSYANGIRSIFLFFGCFIGISFPVWLYFIGFYLWGEGYLLNFFKNITTKPIQKLISYFIISKKRIFYSLFFIIYFIIIFNYFTSYEVGTILGQSFADFVAFAVIMWMLIATANKVKKWNINKNDYALPLFAIVLIFSLTKEIRYKNEAENLEYAVKNEFLNFSEAQLMPLIKDNDNKYVKVSKKLIIGGIETNEKIAEVLNNLAPENIENILLPRNLKSKRELDRFLQEILIKEQLVKNAEEEINNIQRNNIKNIIDFAKKLGINNKVLEDLEYGAESKYKKNYQPWIIKKITLIKNELECLKKIIIFFNDREGKFIFKNNMFLFQGQEDADIYDSYIKTLNDYLIEESKIEKELIEK